MAKYTIAVGRMCVSGTHRAEVGNFLVEVATTSQTDPTLKRLVDDVLHIPISQVPTTAARNKLVKVARKQGVDILFMVDDDASPPEGFFKSAVEFLSKHKGPAVIGAAYVCGGNHQQVQVFEFASPGNHAQTSFKLEHIPREDAARRTGIQQVANIGTHCIAYKMDAFDEIEHPYYEYAYTDSEHTAIIETEDCYCHRKMYFAGVPLYVDWNHWAGHYKQMCMDKPYVLEHGDIERVYMDQARSLVAQKEAAGA